MRLKTIAAEEAPTTYQAHPAPTVLRTKSEPQTKAQKKTPKNTTKPHTFALPRVRFVILALVGVFGLPWLPARQVALKPLPPKSANQLYADVSQHWPTGARGEIKEFPRGHRWPAHLEDPNGYNTVEESREYLKQNASELANILEVLQRTYYPERAYRLPGQTFVGARGLARLSTLAGNFKQQEGDYVGALTHYLDTYALGVQQYQGKSFLSGMIGVLCEGIALASVDPTVAHLTATQARSALQRLEPLVTTRPTLETLIAYERENAPKDLRYYAAPGAQEKLWGKIPAVQLTNEFLIQRYNEAMLELGHTVQQPYRRVIGKSEIRELTWKNLDQLLVIQNAPYLGRATATYTFRTARANRLLLKLALRCWQQEHQGGFPATLNQLVERGYLKTLPTDPYSLSGQDRFHYDASTGTVWSVGIDGIDNNGVGDDLIQSMY